MDHNSLKLHTIPLVDMAESVSNWGILKMHSARVTSLMGDKWSRRGAFFLSFSPLLIDVSLTSVAERMCNAKNIYL